ncbi:uncharacterized protein K452DRAFT_357872 [Aplosporella prunicola CBS 121167]|uniref:Uncharacterized protein n=1 Tax=Aplosporella prunicola CBS 121167 TaxID=1176127 RepID=A0A6A6BIY0_9PEZI|nr:uncharacterized protein K452DRAFT_357872 [Aplosporella prunicola CBS 121167]KAF2142787.1 hypothetical protein K452DRAFT_357872 [Aplosporella prunicola CBS 121167]
MTPRPVPVPLSVTMSGNFDFPPATGSAPSSSNDDNSNSTLPARLQHIRQALQREREQQRATNDQEASERRIRLSDPQPASMPPRRRLRTARGSAGSYGFLGDQASRPHESAHTPDPPTSAIRDRPRAEPGSRLGALWRARERDRAESNTPLTELSELERAGERLAEISASISSLIGTPHNIQNSELLRLGFGDRRDGSGSPSRRSTKRRKLDHDNTPSVPSFRYGHFGQVVSGKLKMEIVSCDGGEYNDSTGDLHRVENALKNDASVYCTKKSHCNLVLRHQGGTTFCLDKIVIKAPERGFTAPVQEGMIFVSMDKDTLLKGTEPYQISYSSESSATSRASSTSSSSSRRPERISLLESLQDPEVLAGSLARRPHWLMAQDRVDQQIQEDRQARFARLLRMRRRIESAYAENIRAPQSNPFGDNCDSETNDRPSMISPMAPAPPPFYVTQEEDDDSSDSDQEQPSASIMADRLRRDSRWRGDTDDEDEDEARMNIFWEPRSRAMAPGILRSARRSTPSKIEPEESAVADGDVLAPHARFFMQKSKSKITIRFDPPVSGKFILLKLWSPSKNGNIDVQHVAAHGFAGPRYFPACEMR